MSFPFSFLCPLIASLAPSHEALSPSHLRCWSYVSCSSSAHRCCQSYIPCCCGRTLEALSLSAKVRIPSKATNLTFLLLSPVSENLSPKALWSSLLTLWSFVIGVVCEAFSLPPLVNLHLHLWQRYEPLTLNLYELMPILFPKLLPLTLILVLQIHIYIWVERGTLPPSSATTMNPSHHELPSSPSETVLSSTPLYPSSSSLSTTSSLLMGWVPPCGTLELPTWVSPSPPFMTMETWFSLMSSVLYGQALTTPLTPLFYFKTSSLVWF